MSPALHPTGRPSYIYTPKAGFGGRGHEKLSGITFLYYKFGSRIFDNEWHSAHHTLLSVGCKSDRGSIVATLHKVDAVIRTHRSDENNAILAVLSDLLGLTRIWPQLRSTVSLSSDYQVRVNPSEPSRVFRPLLMLLENVIRKRLF